MYYYYFVLKEVTNGYVHIVTGDGKKPSREIIVGKRPMEKTS